jgi:twitching motility protein PilT
MDEARLGSILLESRILKESDLERCLELQTITGNTRPLGQILIEQGLLDAQRLDRLLDLQAARLRRQRATSEQAMERSEAATGEFIAAAVARGAHELVVSEGRPVLARTAVDWIPLTADRLSGPEVWEFVRSEMGMSVLEELADRQFVARDLHKPGTCRGRLTAMRHADGVMVHVELRAERAPSVTDLGLHDCVIDQLRSRRGLILLAGERGQGRSELLAAALLEIAKDAGRYVIVLDDALDSPVPDAGALVVRRRVGQHVTSYASALRTSITEDPDAILVGALNDPEAFELALRAVDGGRLVVGWVDAGSVVGCLERVVNFCADHDTASLRAMCVRHLVPAADGEGRVPVVEELIVDEAARDIIRAGDLQNLALLMRSAGGGNGSCFDQHAIELVRQGRIRSEDVYGLAGDKAWFVDRMELVAPRKGGQ